MNQSELAPTKLVPIARCFDCHHCYENHGRGGDPSCDLDEQFRHIGSSVDALRGIPTWCPLSDINPEPKRDAEEDRRRLLDAIREKNGYAEDSASKGYGLHANALLEELVALADEIDPPKEKRP